MTDKMTNKKALEWVMANCTDMPADVAEKIQNQLNTLVNRKSKPKKENEEAAKFAVDVLNFLKGAEKAMTAGDIADAMGEDVSFQKVGSAIKKLGDQVVVADTVKGKKLYAAA